MSNLINIVVPSAGESVKEAQVSAILKPTGTWVAVDDPIVELETDKASMPVNASVAGRIEMLVKEGDVVLVGAVIARIDTSASGEAQGNSGTAPKAGAQVANLQGAPNAQATKEVKGAPPAKAVPAAMAAPVSSVTPPANRAPSAVAGPAAGHLLASAQIKPEHVLGSGRGGRITKEDAINAIKNPRARVLPAPPMPNLGPAVSMPQPIYGERETRKKMSRLRKVVATRLVEAQHNAAMLTTFNEIDMSHVMELRKKYKDRFKEVHGLGLGFMSFFVKAAVEALKQCPDINAYIDGDDICYRNYFDLSVAVSTPKGLVVPVLRNCDKMSFVGIEKGILDFATRGRDGKISMEEMQGGGFTITNGGTFGSLLSTPILNPPQSAILGMHKIEERPIALNGQVVIRPMMYVALSYDHRIVDGKEAVTFLVRIKECIEDPAKIMLEL